MLLDAPLARGWLLISLAALACGNDAPAPAPAPSKEPIAAKTPEPEPGFAVAALDVGDRGAEAVLAEIGAVPAWDAVIGRDALLARRGQSGAVFGWLAGPDEIAPPAAGNAAAEAAVVAAGDGRSWLLDDTRGEGALGIAVVFPDGAEVTGGQRMVLWGAWQVDEAQRWYWQVERAASLPEGPWRPSGALPPPLTIVEVDEPVPEAVRASAATGPATVLLTVHELPRKPGDGWDVSDPGAKKPEAVLRLPGDEESYGALDYRTGAERWRLMRGAIYQVPIARPRRYRSGTRVLRALGAPERVARIPEGFFEAPAPAEPAAAKPALSGNEPSPATAADPVPITE